MHIDTTFVLLGPGKVLVNPEFVDVMRLPAVLKDWQILVAPQPDPIASSFRFYLSLVSKWINLNMLMLDEKRVIVEESRLSMINALKGWGFEPIPMRFTTFYLASQDGMLIETILVVNAGTQLAQLESLAGLLSPGMLAALALLGLVPLLIRKILSRARNRER